MTKATIIALAKAGTPPAEIARQVNRSIETVYHYISEARRNGHDIARFPGGRRPDGRVMTTIPGDVAKRMRESAESRGLTTAQLAQRLVIACVENRLVNAVLDDAGGQDDG